MEGQVGQVLKGWCELYHRKDTGILLQYRPGDSKGYL